MTRTRRMGRIGGLVVSAAAATPFAYLWVQMMRSADDPLTARVRLDMAIWMAVFGTPWMIAAWLLWRAWWRQAGATLSAMDGPAWLLAAAATTLPADRRQWGSAMAAELAQVQGRSARWRFAAGCARAAVFTPRDSRAAVGVTGALAVVATTAAALATGVAGCVALTTWYLAEYPLTPAGHPPTTSATLSPVTSVVLAVVLAGCLWLAVTPPRWLVPDRHARRLGMGMAVAMVAGFVLASRLGLRGVGLANGGMLNFLLVGPLVVVLAGSAAAAAVGRSFRSGLWACAWATVLGTPLLMATWLAEAPRWYRQVGGLLLDADGGGMGANLGDAIWWTLIMLVLWALPFGVLGAAAGSARARRRRARAPAGLVSAPRTTSGEEA